MMKNLFSFKISIAPEISISEFRFLKNDIYDLFNVLGITEEITCYNRPKLNGVTALCALLK